MVIAQRYKGYSSNNNTPMKKKSAGLMWLEINCHYWAKEKGIEMKTEYRFDTVRKFRFDLCFPSLKVGIEYNGIMSAKSRHTTITGYSTDMDKINLAQLLGWKVFQFTPLNYQTALRILDQAIK